MDVLSEKLGTLRLEQATWVRTDLLSGGSLEHAAAVGGDPRQLACHQVLSGSCELVSGRHRVPLTPGRLVLLSRDGPHQLRGAGEGVKTELLCGLWRLEGACATQLTASLPPVMAVVLTDRMTALRAAAIALLPLAQPVPPCHEDVMKRLAEAMLLQAVCAYADQAPAPERELLLGTDRIVSRCLALMHRRPEEPWTLPRLATEVNTSRSVLAERFQEVVGEPPMSHLTRLRLSVAARLLLRTPWTVARVAEAAGYQSEPSFNRAFRRQFGAPPAAWRRRRQDEAREDGLQQAVAA